MAYIRALWTKRYYGALAAVGALCILGLTGDTLAGGPIVISTQNGDWGTGSTWLGGVEPDVSTSDDTQVVHVVGVTLAGETTDVLRIGMAAGAGTLNISSGSLTTSNFTQIGFDDAGTINLTGGSLSVDDQLIVGSGKPGNLNVSGGTLTTTGAAGRLEVGPSSTGIMKVEGNGATITLTPASSLSTAFEVNATGTLTIQPTANGAAGLSTINAVGIVNLVAGSTLKLDVTSYAPQVGDSWDIVAAADAIAGSFTTLDPAAGYTISQANVAARGIVPFKVVITVTGAPAPSLPVAGYAALAALVALLSTAGVIYSRRRMAAVKSR